MTSVRTDFRRGPACGLLAAIVLLAAASPAIAQSGPAAVVCVGSERQTFEAAGAVRRVITEDLGIVARHRQLHHQQVADPLERSSAGTAAGPPVRNLLNSTDRCRG
ncbi:hypothetical protein [Candidatus Palauibacter sp.]|uniref:hypothetical protein n=1 Tax=Candidatus Palauibacter sp. TaxID=3101350 RepID=UPI003B520DFC